MQRRVALATLAVVSLSCASCGRLDGTRADAVRVAVFRYQLSQMSAVKTVCVVLTDDEEADGETAVQQDPHDSLVRRLKQETPRIRKASECVRESDGRVRERATGEAAVAVRIGRISWKGNSAAEVDGQAGEADEGTYILSRVGDQWVVKGFRPRTIS